MIRIAIVDDHKLFTDGVRSLLDDEDNINVLWSAEDVKSTYLSIEQQVPDIILMDIGLGKDSGIGLTKAIITKYPTIKIIAVSMHTDEHYIVKILENGASGYLVKDGGGKEMINAINTVYNGGTYYSNHASQVLIKHVTKGTTPSKKREIPLSKREQEILTLIGMEYSNPEIAKELLISIRTVDTHRRNLLDKLQAKNTAGLVKHAIRFGLVDL